MLKNVVKDFIIKVIKMSRPIEAFYLKNKTIIDECINEIMNDLRQLIHKIPAEDWLEFGKDTAIAGKFLINFIYKFYDENPDSEVTQKLKNTYQLAMIEIADQLPYLFAKFASLQAQNMTQEEK